MLLKAGKHDEVRSTTAPTAAAPFSTSHHIWLLTQAREVYQNATDLGTLNDPMQHPSELFKGLTAQPWHQVSTLRAAGFLESKYSIIKAEVLAALKQRSLEKEAVAHPALARLGLQAVAVNSRPLDLLVALLAVMRVVVAREEAARRARRHEAMAAPASWVAAATLAQTAAL